MRRAHDSSSRRMRSVAIAEHGPGRRHDCAAAKTAAQRVQDPDVGPSGEAQQVFAASRRKLNDLGGFLFAQPFADEVVKRCEPLGFGQRRISRDERWLRCGRLCSREGPKAGASAARASSMIPTWFQHASGVAATTRASHESNDVADTIGMPGESNSHKMPSACGRFHGICAARNRDDPRVDAQCLACTWQPRPLHLRHLSSP